MKSTARRKKALSILLLVAMLCSFATVNAYAAGGSISISSGQASPGERVTVYVNLDSNPGIIALSVAVAYDSNLTLVSASNAGLLPSYQASGTLATNPYGMGWEDSGASADSTVTGRLATLVFEVSKDAKPGDSLKISVSMTGSANYDLDEIAFSGGNGTITVPVSAHDHVWDAGTTTPATCEKDGSTVYKCTVTGCTETKTETIPATGHKWDNGTVTTAPTCTAKGVKTFKCTNSGCTATKTEEIAATGHKWDSGKITTEPTCTKDGVKTISCTNSGCKETKTETVKALGHDMGAATVTKAPTCTEKGEQTTACRRTGCTYKET